MSLQLNLKVNDRTIVAPPEGGQTLKKIPMQPDPELLKQCINGERKGQYLLYKECYSFLYGICARYEQNEEDIVALMNQGFLKVLNNLAGYRKEVPFTAWARRIMVNTIIDAYRSRRRHEKVHPVDFTTERKYDGVHHEESLPSGFDMQILEKAVSELPEPTNRVFNMFIIDGFSHQEIADALGMSVGTSKWHLSRARQILRDKVGRYFLNV